MDPKEVVYCQLAQALSSKYEIFYFLGEQSDRKWLALGGWHKAH